MEKGDGTRSDVTAPVALTWAGPDGDRWKATCAEPKVEVSVLCLIPSVDEIGYPKKSCGHYIVSIRHF